MGVISSLQCQPACQWISQSHSPPTQRARHQEIAGNRATYLFTLSSIHGRNSYAVAALPPVH